MWREKFREQLLNTFEDLKNKNPRFSFRAFARRIGVSHGNLHDFMYKNSLTSLGVDKAAVALERLPCNLQVKNKIFAQMGKPLSHFKRALTKTQYPLLLDWEFYATLFSFDLPQESREPNQIAERTGIRLEKVLYIIEFLLKEKLLEKSVEGRVSRPHEFVVSSDGIADEIIRQHHEMNLDLAKRSLQEHSIDRRDFTSLTFVGSEAQIGELRGEIRRLYEKASALMDGGDENDHVYRLSVQLFPLEFEKCE